MFDPTVNREPAPAHEPGRSLHSIDPEGYETVEVRAPKRGELFADDSGPWAWIFRATADHLSPCRIVKACAAGVYP